MTMTEYNLSTTEGGLSFRLVVTDDVPQIRVFHKGHFCCTYNLDVLAHRDWDVGAPLEGWCVNHAPFTETLTVYAEAHQALVAEADKILRD
jgi:hypothetical protein